MRMLEKPEEKSRRAGAGRGLSAAQAVSRWLLLAEVDYYVVGAAGQDCFRGLVVGIALNVVKVGRDIYEVAGAGFNEFLEVLPIVHPYVAIQDIGRRLRFTMMVGRTHGVRGTGHVPQPNLAGARRVFVDTGFAQHTPGLGSGVGRDGTVHHFYILAANERAHYASE